MSRIQRLESRRKEMLQELDTIRSLRKGSLNEQWFPIVRNGKKTKELRGPYYVWSYKIGKKTVSERLKDDSGVVLARQDAANHRRFKELCGELEEIIAELGEAERDEAVSEERLKKGLKSRSSRAEKSPG